MFNSISKKKGNDISCLITLEELVDAIVSLNNRVTELQRETWRLNDDTKSQHSLWTEAIDKLKLDQTEPIRHSL